MINAFRARADELGSTRHAGRFRPRTTPADGTHRNRVVTQAVARAKEGDREAVRFLYMQYADNVYGYVRSIVRDELRGRGRHAADLRQADDGHRQVRPARPCRSSPG